MDLFRALHQSQLERPFILQDPVSASLYVLRSVYERPMIVECVRLLFKFPVLL